MTKTTNTTNEPKAIRYWNDDDEMANCPNCNWEYNYYDDTWGKPYCPHCGQCLIWYPED